MSWIVLFLAGLLEAGWLISLERSEFFAKKGFVVLAATSMLFSLVFFAYAIKQIPILHAYLVWLAIGTVTMALFNLLVSGHHLTGAQMFFMFLIILGIIGLKISTPTSGA